MSRILVIGGYGGFGARLVRRLTAAGHDVLVGGRSLAKAQRFCEGLAGGRAVQLDRSADLVPVLRDHAPDIVIDAAGPFQQSSYDVPKACITQGCSYLDLADGRDFVVGVDALNEAARAAGVAVISGASTVPALSGAVARSLCEGLDRADMVEIALSASTRSTATRSVTRAILSYAGRPIRIWRGGRWTTGFGGSDLRREKFRVSGIKPLPRRWMALCDVPDLEVLPGMLPGRPAVNFRAGSDRAPQILGLWASSWLVRLGVMDTLEPFGRLFVALQKATMLWSSPRSAMSVTVRGWRDGERLERRWTLIAEQGSGPEIPTIAAALLADRPLAPGARHAGQELELERFEGVFETLPIHHEITEQVLRPTLYRRLMGSAFDRLPPAVRRMHEINGEAGAVGEGRVITGENLFARMACRVMRFPPPGRYPVHVQFSERKGVETWTRDFGGHCFRSVLSSKGRWLSERFGPISFLFDLPSDHVGLAMRLRGWRLLGVPLPLAFAPRIEAAETEDAGRFRFDVKASLPIIGEVIHYSGWLERVDEREQDGAGELLSRRRA